MNIDANAYMSDTQAERILGLGFGELHRARNDVEHGAVVRYDRNGLSYGMDTYGLFWLELDLNRYRYGANSVEQFRQRLGRPNTPRLGKK